MRWHSPNGGRRWGILYAVLLSVLGGQVWQSDPWVAVSASALAAGVLFTAFCFEFRVRLVPVLLAASFLTASPSALGERTSNIWLLLLAAAILISSVTARISVSRASMLASLPAAILGFYWAAIYLTGTGSVGVMLLWGAVLFAVLITPDRDKYEAVCMASAAIAMMGAYWLLMAWTQGNSIFSGTLLVNPVNWREEFVFRSANGIISNSDGPLGFRRLTAFTGEPGALSVFAFVGLAATAVMRSKWSRRVVGVGCVVAIFATASTGAYVLALFAPGVYILRGLGRPKSYTVVLSLAYAILALAVLPHWIVRLLDEKTASSSESITDRGLGEGAGSGRINLVSAFAEDGGVTLLAVCSLSALVILCFRNALVGTVAVVVLASAMLIQPVVYFHGPLMILMFVAALLRVDGIAETGQESVQHKEGVGRYVAFDRNNLLQRSGGLAPNA